MGACSGRHPATSFRTVHPREGGYVGRKHRHPHTDMRLIPPQVWRETAGNGPRHRAAERVERNPRGLGGNRTGAATVAQTDRNRA